MPLLDLCDLGPHGWKAVTGEQVERAAGCPQTYGETLGEISSLIVPAPAPILALRWRWKGDCTAEAGASTGTTG